MFEKSLQVLEQVKATVRWMSLEPLSWDVAPLMSGHPLQWAVIGAASRGRTFYQPKSEWVADLLHIFDGGGTPVYMKSNLEWKPRRIDFPKQKKGGDEMTLPILSQKEQSRSVCGREIRSRQGR